MCTRTIPYQATEAWRVPSKPGVYLIHVENDALYVGKTTNLRERFKQHLQQSHNEALERSLASQSLSFSFWCVYTNLDLDRLERQMIRELTPKFNKVCYRSKKGD